NQIQLEESAAISDFPLKIGWALLSNQKLGKRGSGKRISETIKKYLEAFFVADDQNKNKRMTGAEMVEELNKLVAEREIDDEEVLQ
ncbi:15238_t:CDS:1, partial [Dentiscutata heterogama]